MASTKLTEYELRRLENIKRNREKVAALNIHSTRTQLSSITKRPGPQIKEKKEKNEASAVRRESMRTRGLPPDASASPGLRATNNKKLKPLLESPKLAKEPVAISMSDAYIGDVSDDKLIDMMNSLSRKSVSNINNGGPLSPVIGSVRKEEIGGLNVKKQDLGSVDLDRLNLHPENIARLVTGIIMSVKFFPTADRTLVVVGNTSGNIAFWDVDDKKEDGPGIYVYSPHTATVSGILIEPFSLTKMVTSSYDGSIRLMDAERQTFDFVCSVERSIYYLSGQPNHLQSLYFSEGPGHCKMWDLRAPKCMLTWNLHRARINTIDFNSKNSNLMATSSTDGTACIWDVRNISADKPVSLQVDRHGKAMYSAYFSPSGSLIASTSENSVKIGLSNGANFEDLSVISHTNTVFHTMSFRGLWGWDDSYFYTGNGKGGLDVISIPEEKTIATLRSEYISAKPWRFAAHQCKVGTLAGATAGGEVYIWTSP